MQSAFESFDPYLSHKTMNQHGGIVILCCITHTHKSKFYDGQFWIAYRLHFAIETDIYATCSTKICVILLVLY